MSEPWDLKTDDRRVADSLTTFIIFCEDEVSEPLCFKYFETSKIKINCILKQGSMTKNVINAINHCKKNDLLTKDENRIIERTQVWSVFDRDKEETMEKVELENIEFDLSIKNANDLGIQVAWSNDVFETWVLLHFEEADQTERIYVYNRLTEIFKALPKPNEDLKKVLRYHNFTYKENLKSATNFRNFVRGEIVGKTNQAIKRAKELDESYPPKAKPSEKAPCTKVYLLIEELLQYGQKFDLLV